MATRRQAALAQGTLCWLESGAGPGAPLVLLHGIGSCAASWRDTLQGFADTRRVLAWDAPGYAGSTPLPMTEPRAADYAGAAAAWLEAAEVAAPVVVGHSLGALMAAALAARGDVAALVLVSPAQGYAQAAPAERAAKFSERVDALRRLGRERLAAERSARLCAPGAAPDIVAQVRENMLAITERGYTQAAWMLAHDSIALYLEQLGCPVVVLCGELDTVTPPAGAQALAGTLGAPMYTLPGTGHACYVEAPAAFEAALQAALAEIEQPPHPAHGRAHAAPP